MKWLAKVTARNQHLSYTSCPETIINQNVGKGVAKKVEITLRQTNSSEESMQAQTCFCPIYAALPQVLSRLGPFTEEHLRRFQLIGSTAHQSRFRMQIKCSLIDQLHTWGGLDIIVSFCSKIFYAFIQKLDLH